jgi:hypothetical protein
MFMRWHLRPPTAAAGIVVVVLEENLDREAMADLGGDEGDALRYVYIDRDWEKPDRLAFFVERLKYAALKAFRLTRYVPDPHLLLVVSSPGCRVAGRIDWRDVWNRDYLAAIRAGTEATSK